jgi:hypothetical protein
MAKDSRFHQGTYKPVHLEKYIGKNFPYYRSGLELKVFRMLDFNENVKKWGSETAVIPYINPVDKKPHRYFVDFVILLKDKNNNDVKLLIEIKPFTQTLPPKKSARKKESTIIYENYQYQVNQAKWAAAKKWAVKMGFIFLVLTEKDLFSTLPLSKV